MDKAFNGQLPVTCASGAQQRVDGQQHVSRRSARCKVGQSLGEQSSSCIGSPDHMSLDGSVSCIDALVMRAIIAAL
jgi:hypothetical protein